MTKKIAVVAANGKAGKLIVEEAVQRDMDVTAFVRSENATVAQKAIVRDIMNLTAEDLVGFDAVVDAFGAWTPETLSQHSTTLEHLCDILSGSETRLLVVGGAGSLYVNPEHTITVSEVPTSLRCSSRWHPLWVSLWLICVNATTSIGPTSALQATSSSTASARENISLVARN